jgi:ribonuclease PH
MELLGERTITIDCDVLQGDGGTRTASITGGFVAMMLAFQKMMQAGQLAEYPVSGYVAAVSAGIVEDVPLLDLCYEEDSAAMVDLNCVMDDQGRLIEIQGTGEERPFTLAEQQELVGLCEKGIRQLQAMQKEILGVDL